MDYVRLGTTGLQVSRLCLGCMTYGVPERGTHPWTLDEEASRPFIRRALEVGINFFDTANSYSDGTSEEIVGRALSEFARRDDIVLATKAYHPWRDHPNTGGLSRKALFAAVDDSLKRLGMDYIDLYQIHRWDNQTPIEETLEALNDIVASGKVRYLGASSMFAWQFAKAIYLSKAKGWKQFVSMQPEYNLLYREESEKCLDCARRRELESFPGALSLEASWHAAVEHQSSTVRAGSDKVLENLFSKTEALDLPIIERVGAIAASRGVSPAQIALAWVLNQPVVTCPIIGASKQHHLDDAINALSLKITPEELFALEELYVPRPVVGLNR